MAKINQDFNKGVKAYDLRRINKNFIKGVKACDLQRINKNFIKEVRANDLRRTLYTLKCGADVHFECDRALLFSASNGNSKMVKLLLDNGAYATATYYCSELSILERAVRDGYIKIVKILLKHDINIKKELALRYSAGDGRAAIVELLLKNGANVHADNDIALLCSVAGEHYEVTIALLKAGANVNSRNDTPLRSSVAKVNLALTAKLLECGANIRCLNDEILKNLGENFNEELADVLLPYCGEECYHYFPKEYIKAKIVSTKSAANIR